MKDDIIDKHLKDELKKYTKSFSQYRLSQTIKSGKCEISESSYNKLHDLAKIVFGLNANEQ